MTPNSYIPHYRSRIGMLASRLSPRGRSTETLGFHLVVMTLPPKLTPTRRQPSSSARSGRIRIRSMHHNTTLKTYLHNKSPASLDQVRKLPHSAQCQVRAIPQHPQPLQPPQAPISPLQLGNRTHRIHSASRNHSSGILRWAPAMVAA